MRVLISGICGFAGSKIAHFLNQQPAIDRVLGFDNFARPGSQVNEAGLHAAGIEFFKADVRNVTDMARLPVADWVIDAAATPSVLAGVNSKTSSRELVDTNLGGTIHLLEYCKAHGAGLVLLSSSRVYSIDALRAIPLRASETRFELETQAELPVGLSAAGLSEAFSTAAPISLYGATKLSSEQLAIEYGAAFDFPVRINRCGVLAGGGQFGRADQGIFAFWLHSWREQARLQYLGFDGLGRQVRDCLHPEDLARLILKQISTRQTNAPQLINVSGGQQSSASLQEISAWCADRWGPMEVARVPDQRMYDVPWVVLDSSLAQQAWSWQPTLHRDSILQEIAEHAEQHPEWLRMSRG